MFHVICPWSRGNWFNSPNTWEIVRKVCKILLETFQHSSKGNDVSSSFPRKNQRSPEKKQGNRNYWRLPYIYIGDLLFGDFYHTTATKTQKERNSRMIIIIGKRHQREQIIRVMSNSPMSSLISTDQPFLLSLLERAFRSFSLIFICVSQRLERAVIVRPWEAVRVISPGVWENRQGCSKIPS